MMWEETMKCKECQDSGKTSRVYPGGSSVTAMHCPAYYDENGVYHHHNMNVMTTHYECSNGHSWSESTRNECPARSCDWGKDKQ
jgi:hypothetical protein